jgi:hypothetical protein
MFGEESNVDVDVLTKKNIEQQNVETAPIVNVSQRNVNKLETRGNLDLQFNFKLKNTSAFLKTMTHIS